jgi:hypothetical protein
MLLAGWLGEIRNPVAWISMDERDNDLSLARWHL